MNEVCPICRKTTVLTELISDNAILYGNLVEMIKKWEPVGWMLEDGTVIIYHKYCMEKFKK